MYNQTLHDELLSVRDNAELICSANELEKAIENIASEITSDFYDKNPLLLCVLTGGLHFTALLTRHLDFPWELDYLNASRYGQDTVGSDITWYTKPKGSLANRHVILLDDIFDEGLTLEALNHYCLTERAASVNSAVMTNKNHQRKPAGYKPNYQGINLPDRYVFGCGLDYKGYWRGLPDIYALK